MDPKTYGIVTRVVHKLVVTEEGGFLAKTGSCTMHGIIPKEREWFSVLCCVNAAGDYLPSFYIFKNKLFQRDFIKGCEEGATIDM